MNQRSLIRRLNPDRQVISGLYNFWQFSRPHTIIGTSLSVLALYLIALAIAGQNLAIANLAQGLGVWLVCLCGNIYIVGLNQLEDIAIDKINKPHLPLAAGTFSPRQGWWIVGTTGVLAMLGAGLLGPWVLATVGTSVAIGTAYSLPPIRLKRFPFLAALCIFTVRGVVVNLGLFAHFSEKFSGRAAIPPAIAALTFFIVAFTVAIAIFKDVPDLEGDRKYRITTFTLLLGKLAIFKIACGIIIACYFGMVLAGLWGLSGISSEGAIVGHLILLGLLGWRSQNVDLNEKSEIAQFYQFIWKLFFLEYLLFPLICWLA